MSVEKIRRVVNVKDFDFINLNDYNISLDIVNRKLVFDVKDGVFIDDSNLNNFISSVRVSYIFKDNREFDVILCETDDGCLYSLYDVSYRKSKPLTLSFHGYIKNAYINDVYDLKSMNKIIFHLSPILMLPVDKSIELKDLKINVFLLGNDFTVTMENKANLSVDNFRKKALLCIKLLSLVFYSPLRVEKEILFVKDLIYDYVYEDRFSGDRVCKIFSEYENLKLFDVVFTEDNIQKFLDKIDDEYSVLLNIYLYLLDKKNTNFTHINDFLLIQFIISWISKLENRWVDSVEALNIYLKSKYIILTNVGKMISNFSESLRDKRNYIGHMTILFKNKGGSERKYSGSDCLNVKEYFKLILSVPFYIYDVFGLTISSDIITTVFKSFDFGWK